MNFYKHHIGDYAAATSHLSILEDGVFRRLLCVYYRDEKPLPLDLKAVQRLVGARSKDERAAVETVLQEFFALTDDGWRNKRCDDEIEAYREAEGESEERKRHETERKRRYRQRRSELFDALRERGIVPAFDTSLPELEAMLSRGTGRGQGRGRDGDGTAIQTPDSRLQEETTTPDRSSRSESLPTREPSQARPTDAGIACRLMREAGCNDTNPSHPRLLEALGEGVTPQALADTAREAVAAGKTRPFAYAITTARNRHAEAAQTTPQGSRHAPHQRPARLGLADRFPAQPADDAIDGQAVRVHR